MLTIFAIVHSNIAPGFSFHGVCLSCLLSIRGAAPSRTILLAVVVYKKFLDSMEALELQRSPRRRRLASPQRMCGIRKQMPRIVRGEWERAETAVFEGGKIIPTAGRK